MHHWEHEDDSEESDLELDPTPEQAGSFLVDFLLHMLLAGQVSAKLVCVVCYWAWKAGAKGPVKDFTVQPGQASGNYQKKVDRACGVDLHANSSFVQLDVPGQSKHNLSRTIFQTPVRAPHEVLNKEMSNWKAWEISGMVEEHAWPESYHSHPVVQAASPEPVLGVALYVDGVP